ncbi:membrane protein DedA with SNARE-associated domain [Haloactinospora alba]|uniref:Membrane protein DedA with SNARE-associated domain n=1 Tax=Haloactinospora alba TaxID=405555 RepID=A0A543NG85_9ACTN|nr:VTT domain-containing protein [Haloactinospora alba]TQN30858.1 membrane protein DedA with SNARE-associated domain [Haloactinospora alba]
MDYGFLEGEPFWTVYLVLGVIALLRTQTIYWLGRFLGKGVRRSRLAIRLGERLDRAQRMIDRFGPPAVTLSYLTVGIQSAIHLTAGAMRMSFPRYLAAALPGSALWAAVYSLGGMAALTLWWRAFLRSPLVAVTAATLLLLLAIVLLVVWRRRSGAGPRTANDTGVHTPELTGSQCRNLGQCE